MHLLAFLPNGHDDFDVAAGDQDGRDDKHGQRDEGHVQLPLPRLVKVNPTLRPVILGLDCLKTKSVCFIVSEIRLIVSLGLAKNFNDPLCSLPKLEFSRSMIATAAREFRKIC